MSTPIEIQRPRDPCRNYFNNKLKGYILTNIFAVIALLVGFYSTIESKFSVVTDLRITVAKLETTISEAKKNRIITKMFNGECNIAEYQNYIDYTDYQRTVYR